MASEHIIKSYDDELSLINNATMQRGGLAGGDLDAAIDAVIKRDSELAAGIAADDTAGDQLEQEVDGLVVGLLAVRQPMARDLRDILAALRIASDLERICDYAANVAKRSIVLNQLPAVRPVYTLPRMVKLAQALTKDVLDAYVARDADKALIVWARDEELDEMYSSLFRELLTYMMEDPRNITACTHLLFMAKNVERIGDHATNIAETVYFLVNGSPLTQARPKRDNSNQAVAPPVGGRGQPT